MDNPIDMILDPNNDKPITLYGEDGTPSVFEQIAVIPMDLRIYVILKLVEPLPDSNMIGDDEAFVFCIAEHEGEECLELVVDDTLIDCVFGEYYKMLEEAGIV